MKFSLCSVILVLASAVIGSKLTADVKEAALEIPHDSSESETEIIEDQEFIKQKFIYSLINGHMAETKYYAEKYDYLTNKFNRDIFTGLMKCFDNPSKEEICWKMVELLKPSFKDVSYSTTTPLILAIRQNKMSLVNALLKLEEIKGTLDNVDEFDRTALMYAAKRGSYFAVKRILDISNESINRKDFMGKTAIHYACEMNPLTDAGTTDYEYELPTMLTGAVDLNVQNKKIIVSMLIGNGGRILQDGPGYKLTSADTEVNHLITGFGGKVHVESKIEDVVVQTSRAMAMFQMVNLLKMSKMLNKIDATIISVILANPVMMALNNLCYHVMQILLPGVDVNLNVSIDVGESIYDFSFNLLFVLLMVPVVKQLIENYFKKPGAFKF